MGNFVMVASNVLWHESVGAIKDYSESCKNRKPHPELIWYFCFSPFPLVGMCMSDTWLPSSPFISWQICPFFLGKYCFLFFCFLFWDRQGKIYFSGYIVCPLLFRNVFPHPPNQYSEELEMLAWMHCCSWLIEHVLPISRVEKKNPKASSRHC